jgi:hypothetical protein
MLPMILFWLRESLQILIKAPMLNYPAQFFFADLPEKTISRILGDNYFAPEQKLKLTRSVSTGDRSLRIRAIRESRNSVMYKRHLERNIRKFPGRCQIALKKEL